MDQLREIIRATIEFEAGAFLDEETIEELTDKIMDDVSDAVHQGTLLD